MPDPMTYAHMETYLEEYGTLIPTANYVVMLRMIADQMEQRGFFDARNYIMKAMAILEA